jgi:DNA-binding response OmpR family regulator
VAKKAQMRAMDNPATVNEDRLLLIEDDPATARAMTRLMNTVGVSVEPVATLKEGLAALSRMPAVVVLDLMLPDGCGVEVLEAIRATGLQCKVAVVSGSTDTEVFKRLRAARPDAIFPKPLDFQDFVNWLCEAFPENPGMSVAA